MSGFVVGGGKLNFPESWGGKVDFFLCEMPKQDVNFTGFGGSGMGPITRYWFLFLNLFHLVRTKL